MTARTQSTFARRFFTALALGSLSFAGIAQAASPGPAAAEVKKAPKVEVVASAIALGVEGRNPVGAGEVFDGPVDGLYAWVKVKNPGEATTITMVWKLEGKKKLAVTLPVGHAWGWKTWSKKGASVKEGGSWTVEVLDADGALLDTLAFRVNIQAPSVGGR
ncbi:MAG: DUF2914 domain-containing protein [Deltaproteobacteria bacterium]|nr:DUF2914 domain-containing protein [Deltaproteobacteria bacterium]